MRKIMTALLALSVALTAGCGDKPKEGKAVDPKDVNKMNPSKSGKTGPE